MTQINCLKCKQSIDADYDLCPHCGEKVTLFQRTYASRLLDGKYQIIDRLGIGGMGEIFKVRHIHLNELRVIKIMRPNVAADDQGLQRFLQEARTSTMIKHKNLAMLYDFAQLEDGSYYMVWEFIDGTNIQKWLSQNGAMPARLTVEIAIQALDGLEHLHSMGLIHRDVSPENIMLSQDHHGKLMVKVIDFGIAKQLAEGDGGQGLTQTGMFLGKLKYASPEQAGFLKDGEHLDARSDLYSFGIVMYEMLAGRAPFQATNPHGYILKHVTEKPIALAEMNPAAHVPPQLESLIMKSLEKQREQRFTTAEEFAQALGAVRSSIPPDQKYGLGEKMITLSGAQTLAELPKMTGTSPQVTAGGAQPTQQQMQQGYGRGTFPGGTMPGGTSPGNTRAANESTVIERAARPSPKTIGNDEATVMERLEARGAEPTSIEPKWSGGAQAEATVLERQISMEPPRKKNNALLAAIAAVVILGIAGALYMVNRKPAPGPVPVTDSVVSTSGTELTTAPPTTTQVIPDGKGVLLLSASPWGELDRIVRKSDQQEMPITDDERPTPTGIKLGPGDYAVTLNGPTGDKTVDVRITAGRATPKHVSMSGVDVDALAQDALSEEKNR
ncbi:MAG: serine/threonine-protein kinase [Acidobacteriota bacterium]